MKTRIGAETLKLPVRSTVPTAMQAHPGLMWFASASNWLPWQCAGSMGSTDQIAGSVPSAYEMAIVGWMTPHRGSGGWGSRPRAQIGDSVVGKVESGMKFA